MAERRPIDLNAGWSFMERGIHKLKRILENEHEAQFTASHYMNLYTTIYNMCTQKPPHDYSAELYARYGQAFSAYIAERVLPALRGHSGEFLLSELWTRWSNHKLMVRWLSRFFNYLDRYYIARHTMHALPEVGLMRFRDEVYEQVKKPAREALLDAVAKERAGEVGGGGGGAGGGGGGRPLLKNVLSIFIEVGMGSMDCYQRDFEAGLVEATREHYARVAAAWVEVDSCPEYMAKAEAALRSEEERVDAYLHASSRPRLMAAAEQALLAAHAAELLGKEGSGVSALLADGRREDLARMYRLFVRVPRGLDPVAAAFRAHVEGEGNALLRRAEDAAAARREKAAEAAAAAAASAAGGAGAGAGPSAAEKAAEKTAGAAAEHQFVRDAVALHDKYLSFVAECFQNSSLFHKALKEAFEAFCNKAVGGSQMSELMANYCDALLRKGSSGVGAAAAAVAAAAAGGGAGGGGGRGGRVGARGVAADGEGEAPSPGGAAGAAAAAAAAAASEAAAAAAADDNVDLALEKVIELLPFVSDKDMFSEYYKKKLGRRLLFGSGAANDDAERSVLARLKQQCGSQFTSKMEGMLTDLSLAREKQNAFNEWRAARAGRLGQQAAEAARSPAQAGAAARAAAVDLSVTVLTTGFWPKYPSFDLQLPPELAAGVAAFTEFYESTNLHRKLTWQYTIGSCHLRGNFSQKPLELVLATTQAAALMLFNDAPGETLGYSELRERLRMPDDDAQRVLASLSVLKHRVLLKRDGASSGGGGRGGGGGGSSSAAATPAAKASRRISPTDVFTVNAAFSDRMRRVKIPLPQISSEEKRKVVEDVSRDRASAIDAAVVRTMKARKLLSHRDLLLEITPQLAKVFQPDPKVIKKQIESLIEREYMVRDPERPTVYKYLA